MVPVETAIPENRKTIIFVERNYDRTFSIVEKKKGLFRVMNKAQRAVSRVVICVDVAHTVDTKWYDKIVRGIANFSKF